MATGISKDFVCLLHGGGEFSLLPGGKPHGRQNRQELRLGDSGLATHLHFNFSMSANVGFFVPLNNAINDPVAVSGKLCSRYNHWRNMLKLCIFTS
ncbi:MAG: hypothetical protein NTV93_14585 [Verrucomicrobia bacterium]|nr:hypothetical protein [Verrucomicrobiota bacterium]